MFIDFAFFVEKVLHPTGHSQKRAAGSCPVGMCRNGVLVEVWGTC